MNRRKNQLKSLILNKKATTKDMSYKRNLKSKFDKKGYRYNDDDNKITLSDCEEQIRTWAKSLAER